MRAAICGIGVTGGFGSGLAELEKALGTQWVAPTPTDIPCRQGTVRVPCLTADTRPLSDYISPKRIRRTNHFIRLALLAAYGALDDAGLLENENRHRLGIVVATGNGATGNNYAFQPPFDQHEETCCSPIRFSNSVYNSAAAFISIVLHAMGPNHTISHGDLSFPSALLTAMAWLKQRWVDAVLVGGVDVLSHAQAYAWHERERINGFYANGDKRALPFAGEGACFFVLGAADTVSSPYGEIEVVKVGRNIDFPSLPSGDRVVIGNGGVIDDSANYGKWSFRADPLLSYRNLYGVLPVDSAFDTAIAALSLKNDCIYTCPGGVPSVDRHGRGNGSRIHCLKPGADGNYGWITIK